MKTLAGQKPPDHTFTVALSALVNLVLLGAAGICLLIVCYFIYHYYWIAERSFSNFAGFVLYIIVPLVLAALGVVTLRLPLVWKSRIVLLWLSCLVSALSLEIALTIWRSLPTIVDEGNIRVTASMARKYRLNFDSRTVGQVLDDLRRKGIEAYPAGAPSALLQKEADGTRSSKLINGEELLPLGGVSNKMSVLCNEGLGYTIFASDEHGFHNPRGIWGMERVDIAAVGDSYVQGYCVPSENNFVAEIRKRYPATLNLGSGGMGPLMSLGVLREYLQFVQPKIVLWVYYEGNDAKDLKTESESPLLMRYLTGSRQGLLDRQPEIDRRLSAFLTQEMAKHRLTRLAEEIVEGLKELELEQLTAIPRLGNLRDAVGLVYGQSALEPRSHPNPYIREFKKLYSQILVEAKTQVIGWGGKIYFVYLPTWRPNWINHEEDNEITSMVSSLGIPIIDMRPAFLAHGDPLALFPYRMHNHYNVEGNRLVAEEILLHLSREVDPAARL
jgi:hypothetical protein